MVQLSAILVHHLKALSVAYPVGFPDHDSSIIVRRFMLPPGYNRASTDILVGIPEDYPLSPPGIGSRVYLPPDLRFRNRELRDLHKETTPGWGNWAWFCYDWIRWDPCRDNLITFMEILRTDLTEANAD